MTAILVKNEMGLSGMNFEQNFFTNAQGRSQGREAELQRLKAAQEALAAEKADLEASFYGLKERAAQRAKLAKQEYDPVGHYTFLEIVEKARFLSEYFSMDLTVTLEKGQPGKITLATDRLRMDQRTPKSCRDTFLQMLNAADGISLAPADGLIQLTLYYSVYQWSHPV